jgi:hypothetical protein
MIEFALAVIIVGLCFINKSVNTLTKKLQEMADLIRKTKNVDFEYSMKNNIEQLVWTISGISSSGLTYNDKSMVEILTKISNTLVKIEQGIQTNRL